MVQRVFLVLLQCRGGENVKLKRTIQTKRLRLRPYRREDLPFVTEMWFEPETNRYLSDPLPQYVDDTYRNALAQMENSKNGCYLIAEERKTARPVGSCCVFPDEAGSVFDIGYCIHRELWGQGYGGEMVEGLVRWAWQNGAQAVTAEVAQANTASNALLRRLGFSAVGESSFRKYNMPVEYASTFYRMEMGERRRRLFTRRKSN